MQSPPQVHQDMPAHDHVHFQPGTAALTYLLCQFERQAVNHVTSIPHWLANTFQSSLGESSPEEHGAHLSHDFHT
jgi:hypothetical protein